MTTITSLDQLGLLATPPTVQATASSSTAPAVKTETQPSTTVTLGQKNASSTIGAYSFSVAQSSAAPALWENDSNDAISSSMRLDFSNPTLAYRFHDLGASLLNRFKTDSGDFSQSVMQLASTTAQGANASTFLATMRSELHTQADNQITLDVVTAGGAKVELTLGSQDNGLAVQVKISNGKLSDADRGALVSLSDAFQSAINGLTAVPPQLDLSGLTQFDSSVLSSVDLHANVKVDDQHSQTVDFHADSQKRTLSSNGPSGKMQVNVDMSKPATLGSAAQQAQAIDSYLKQFDDAQKRGNADASLMTMFKAAFTEMNSNYGTKPTSWGAKNAATSTPLGDHGEKALTGLADFNASVTQTAVASNPMRPGEFDAFSYQSSQNTSITTGDQQSRSIKQQQQSHLSASYHQALSSDIPLLLTSSAKSQNYYYYQINDDASSLTGLEYNEKGALVSATSNQSASRSTHVQKYLLGQLTEDKTTPFATSQSRDLLKLLKSAQQDNQSIIAGNIYPSQSSQS